MIALFREKTFNFVSAIPKDINIIAESGIKTYSNIQSYNEAGIYNFLIGESILKENNINKKFKELLNI